MQLTPDEQITELQAEVAKLRGKLSRKDKAGRPAICLCGHKRHAAQCLQPGCPCEKYVADPRSGNAARKRARMRANKINGEQKLEERITLRIWDDTASDNFIINVNGQVFNEHGKQLTSPCVELFASEAAWTVLADGGTEKEAAYAAICEWTDDYNGNIKNIRAEVTRQKGLTPV